MVVSGERSSWLTSEVKRASRSIRSWSWSTIVLNDWVRPAQVGVLGRRAQPGVEVAPGDGDGGPRHGRERPQRASAGQPADQPAEHGRDEPAEHERQGEHVQGVVEVVQVEDREVLERPRARPAAGSRPPPGAWLLSTKVWVRRRPDPHEGHAAHGAGRRSTRLKAFEEYVGALKYEDRRGRP